MYWPPQTPIQLNISFTFVLYIQLKHGGYTKSKSQRTVSLLCAFVSTAYLEFLKKQTKNITKVIDLICLIISSLNVVGKKNRNGFIFPATILSKRAKYKICVSSTCMVIILLYPFPLQQWPFPFFTFVFESINSEGFEVQAIHKKVFTLCSFTLHTFGQLLTSTVKKHLQANEMVGTDWELKNNNNKKNSTPWPTLCVFTEMCSVLWVSVVQESLCLPTGHWAQNIKGKPKLDSQSLRNTFALAVGISKQREEDDIYQFIICFINDSNMWDR